MCCNLVFRATPVSDEHLFIQLLCLFVCLFVCLDRPANYRQCSDDTRRSFGHTATVSKITKNVEAGYVRFRTCFSPQICEFKSRSSQLFTLDFGSVRNHVRNFLFMFL